MDFDVFFNMGTKHLNFEGNKNWLIWLNSFGKINKDATLYERRNGMNRHNDGESVVPFPSFHNHGSVENECISNISFLSFRVVFHETMIMGESVKETTGWWFQIFLIFIPIWGRFPF